MKRGIIVNTRSLTAELSGVQRYVGELCARLGERLQQVAPGRPLQGIKGHLWEQCWLPAKVRSRLLWSPANTGPLFLDAQVITIHDLAALDHPEWFAPRFSGWYRCMIPRIARRARAVITASKFTKDRLIETTGIAAAKIHVIPNGVDERFRPCAPEDAIATQKQLGIPSPRYVLSLGTLEPRKNVRGQLEAWSRCVGQLPTDVWLVVAGRAGQRHVFAGATHEHVPPRVHFTGFVPDAHLPMLYAGALAFLYPSIYEGFGLPALEAMASGTVPIVSNSTSLPEVAADAALVVDPLDSDAIAAATIRLVTDTQTREALRERALRQAGVFNWKEAAAKTWEVLTQANATLSAKGAGQR